VRSVHPGPATGLVAQLVLLAAVDAAVGLDRLAWATGTAVGVGTALLLDRAMVRAGTARLGPADRVTLTRAVLVGAVAALVAQSYVGAVPVPALVSLASVALVLDAVDGWVARRTGTVTASGARFDMEVDAFLILVLSVLVAPAVGPWVLAIGAMRYAYVVAGWALPWLCRPVPPRYWRKVVAAVQGVTLTVVASGLLAWPVAVASLLGALAMLTESFGRDVAWQWRHRTDADRPDDARGHVLLLPVAELEAQPEPQLEAQR
jgi:phosphatidylglycerophosphate synthase